MGTGSASTGAATSTVLAALSLAMIAGGLLMQRVFDLEVLGALSLLLWPGYLLGAMLLFFGVVGFVVAMLSTAATMGVVAVQRQRRD